MKVILNLNKDLVEEVRKVIEEEPNKLLFQDTRELLLKVNRLLPEIDTDSILEKYELEWRY